MDWIDGFYDTADNLRRAAEALERLDAAVRDVCRAAEAYQAALDGIGALADELASAPLASDEAAPDMVGALNRAAARAVALVKRRVICE